MRRQAEIYMVPGVDENAPGVDPVKKRKAAQDQASFCAISLECCVH